MSTPPARRCTGVILAGGQASRMGGVPKGLLEICGIRMIDRVATALRAATDDLVLVANEPAADGWLSGVRRVADVERGLGALSGIHAALSATATDILVIAWDAPFVPAGLMRTLRNDGEQACAGMAAPKSQSPWGFEPLCAWFSHDALHATGTLLGARDGRVGALAERLTMTTVDASSWGDPDDIFFNVNTPADLDRAATIAARLAP